MLELFADIDSIGKTSIEFFDGNSTLDTANQYGQGGNPLRTDLALFFYMVSKDVDGNIREEFTFPNTDPSTDALWETTNPYDGWREFALLAVLKTDPIYVDDAKWRALTMEEVKVIAAAEANVYMYNSEDLVLTWRLEEIEEQALMDANENNGCMNSFFTYSQVNTKLAFALIHYRNKEYKKAQEIIDGVKYSCYAVPSY